MLPRFHLLRHGETLWSVTGRHTGRTDISLTPKGEDQALALGMRLGGTAFSRVLTSPLNRARQTCALVALPPHAEIEPDLAEWDYGDYEGKLGADIRHERPEWVVFNDGAPHGETPAQIAARADRLITRMRTMSGNIALFTHGHFGRVLAARWVGFSIAQSRPFLLSPASHSILSFEHDQPDEPAIELWNAVPLESPSAPRADTEAARAVLKQRAVDRWENEGGEIPLVHPPLSKRIER
ncbi:MAG TPA: histidine phosphatase family protein [Lacunisphaera sp.]|nr:histidine phosphatase family protein [Lacunisphaera sp.]